MISINEALKSIDNQKIILKKISMDLDKSFGFALAEEIKSPFDLPSFDNSAMDGYALCGESDEYKIVGIIPTGETAQFQLKPGQAARIFTGAKIPENTFAVLMQEKAEINGDFLKPIEKIRKGLHIRLRGSELEKGQLVFSPGHQISPASIGLIGSLGLDKVQVYGKPNISVMTSGDELISPGDERQEGQIYESNSLALGSALESAGFSLQRKEQVPDDFEKIKSSISDLLKDSDLLILSGGISVGDFDFVKDALEANGVVEIFYKVFQKPGKPLFFGKRDDKFVFALPGNPASSLTCFYIYVLPLLQRMSGFDDLGLPQIKATLAHDYHLKGDRPSFLKASLKNNEVRILDGQGSSMIHSMANSNALVFIEFPKEFEKGELVTCILLA